MLGVQIDDACQGSMSSIQTPAWKRGRRGRPKKKTKRFLFSVCRLDRNDRRDSDRSRHQRDKDRHRHDDSSDEKDYQTHRRDDSRGEKDYQKERWGTAINPRRNAKSRSSQHGTRTRWRTTGHFSQILSPLDQRNGLSGIGESSLTVAGQGNVILTATVNGEHLHGKMGGVLVSLD